MSDRDTGRSRGFGFVSFDVPDAVEQIMAMHKAMGRKIKSIKWAQKTSSRAL